MENITININDTTSLPDLLRAWKDLQIVKKELVMNEDTIKNRIKIFLKENRWDKYTEPETNMRISLVQGKTETFDKQQLRLMLTEQQYAQALKITTYEKMMILTPEDMERLKKFMKKKIGGNNNGNI